MTERRAVHRTLVSKRCRIVFNDATYECLAINLTSRGACLDLPSTVALNQRFELSFDCGRTVRHCTLIWRAGQKVGIAWHKDTRPEADEGIDRSLPKSQTILSSELFPSVRLAK